MCFRDKSVLYRVDFWGGIKNKKSLKSLDFLGFFAGKEELKQKRIWESEAEKRALDSFKIAMDGG